ncbi:MAG: CPBP family intramembrane metalloprotease [Ruminococcus sp.]|nr:CPBP family intramembrane metalloprotease [Ruminococcus sp.]
MSKAAQRSENKIINVIDEFDYSTQNDSYNEQFRKWRRHKENKFSFSFSSNKNESIFIDGKGFIEENAVNAEKEIITKIFYVIGNAMLMWLVTDTIIVKFLIKFLSIIGVDVHNNFFNTSVYGGSMEIVIVLVAVSVIKVLASMIYIRKRFKVPLKVEFMHTMNHPSGLLTAISLVLLVCTAVNIPSAFSGETKEIYSFFRSIDTDVSVWGQAEFVIYTVFDIIVMSILNEMMFRGAMFAVCRQFGDAFAIIMTSLTAALLTHDFSDMGAVFLISAIGSYGMLRSGSIFTPIAVNIVYKMYSLALAIIEVDPSVNMSITRGMFMAAVFLSGAFGFIVCYLHNRKKNIKLAVYESEFSQGGRILFAVKVFPYIAVGIICIVYAIVGAMF